MSLRKKVAMASGAMGAAVLMYVLLPDWMIFWPSHSVPGASAVKVNDGQRAAEAVRGPVRRDVRARRVAVLIRDMLFGFGGFE